MGTARKVGAAAVPTHFAGERSVGELVSELGTTQPQVSKHLRVLLVNTIWWRGGSLTIVSR